MNNYTEATAKDLADTLLRHGRVSFAARYETDSDGAILEGEDWFGASIINQFGEQCILVTGYGGGMCFAYDVTQANDIVPAEATKATQRIADIASITKSPVTIDTTIPTSKQPIPPPKSISSRIKTGFGMISAD